MTLTCDGDIHILIIDKIRAISLKKDSCKIDIIYDANHRYSSNHASREDAMDVMTRIIKLI